MRGLGAGQWVHQSKAGKPHGGRDLTRLDRTIVVVIAAKWNRLGPTLVQLGNADGLVIEKSGMQELDLKRQFFPVPPGFATIELDLAELIVAELAQPLGDIGFRRNMRAAGERLRPCAQGFKVEFL